MEKAKNIIYKIWHSYVWLFIILLAIDIITKNVVVVNLAHKSDPTITLIPGFLRIQYVVNTHAAFGIGADNPTINRVVYIIVASLASIGIIIAYIYKRKSLSAYYKACLMLVLAGAIGNLIDRIFYTPSYLNNTYNGVVDWIDFCGIWAYHFNIADSCVVIAAFMLIIYMIIDEIKNYLENKKDDNKKINNDKVLSKEEQERLQIINNYKKEENKD